MCAWRVREIGTLAFLLVSLLVLCKFSFECVCWHCSAGGGLALSATGVQEVGAQGSAAGVSASSGALLTTHSILVGKPLGLYQLTDKEMEVQRREGAHVGTFKLEHGAS